MAYTPVVLMHGITADNSSVGFVKTYLESRLPGIYVRAVEIGDGYWDSIFTPMATQVSDFCQIVASDSHLAGGFNLIGFSQGGVIARGYLERCNKPPVKNFISWVSPQMGVYGVPQVGHISYVNVTLDALADCCIYDAWVQDLISFAGYWRDPFNLAGYRKYCKFLPDVNNDGAQKNNAYKQNVLSLKNFVMAYSLIDMTLIPRETGWFGVYAPNSDKVVIPLEEQDIWKQDWIGLRKLNETGRLHRFTTMCEHGDYGSACFTHYFSTYVLPFLAD